MATTTETPTKGNEAANVTIPEATLGSIAGALVGYAGFGILVTASIAGMLLGSLAGARLGERRLHPAVAFETERRANQD